MQFESPAFLGGHIYNALQETDIDLHRDLRSLHCDSNRAIGDHGCNMCSMWNCRKACESWLQALNPSDWQLENLPVFLAILNVAWASLWAVSWGDRGLGGGLESRSEKTYRSIQSGYRQTFFLGEIIPITDTESCCQRS